jgi:hypothetical protein
LSKIQSDSSCIDFGGGSPSLGNSTVFVVVADEANPETVYYSDFVALGAEFVTEESVVGGIGNGTTITVYASEVLLPENMVQAVSFISSCSTDLPLFLQDRFGSMHLVAFTNDEQGAVDSIVDITLVLTIYSVVFTTTILGRAR